jgi:GH18 family chitinase
MSRYAKWFTTIDKTCNPKTPETCKFPELGGNTDETGKSAALRWEPTGNKDVPKSFTKEAWTSAQESLARLPKDESDTYDSETKADRWFDSTSSLFWTWQGPKAITETCDGLQSEAELGGYFVWSLGQDDSQLLHLKALQNSCWQHRTLRRFMAYSINIYSLFRNLYLS